MYQTLRQIARTGIVSEPPPHSDEALRQIEQRLDAVILKRGVLHALWGYGRWICRIERCPEDVGL